MYIMLVCICAVTMQAQNVSNVAFYQDGKNVIVTYSLDIQARVSLHVSTDGGIFYSAPLQHVSGDVGNNVKAGSNQIIWDVLSERENLVGDNIVFRIVALGGMHNGHKCVDLGLPSGTLWAACNVGAKNPEECGNYFAWGELRQKALYDWMMYVHCNYSSRGQIDLLRYNKRDKQRQMNLSHDAAHTILGGNWRIPTSEEVKELLQYCNWILTSRNGVMGYRIIGRNREEIFLPFAGYMTNQTVNNIKTDGYYWTSTISETHLYYAECIHFNFSRPYQGSQQRYMGLPIRAVLNGK